MIGNEKNTPFVFNFAQTMEYQPNNMVGTYLGETDIGLENGFKRKVVKWEPKDPVKKENAGVTVETPVLERNLDVIGQGSPTPRKVYMLFPDRFHELPKFLRGGDSFESSGDNRPSRIMGLILAEVYKQKGYQEMLKQAVMRDKDVLKKVRFGLQSSELDDMTRERIMQDLDKLERIAEVNSNKKSSNSD